MHNVPSTIVWVRVRPGIAILKAIDIVFGADKVKTCEKPVLAKEIVL
jgi:hypothetical protein